MPERAADLLERARGESDLPDGVRNHLDYRLRSGAGPNRRHP
jgi:hypothetical protein